MRCRRPESGKIEPPADRGRGAGGGAMNQCTLQSTRPPMAHALDPATALTSTPSAKIERIAARCASRCTRRLRRRGAVLGLSGGIDSTVTRGACRHGLRAGQGARPCSCRRSDSDPDSLRLGQAVAAWLGIETVDRGYRADPRPPRPATSAATASSAASCPNSARAGAARSPSPIRWRARATASPICRAVAGRRDPQAAHAARRLSRRRRRDQHEAADAQADRVLPRRPAELRGARHAQPARIRPGLLRQERRRRGRRQADRPSLQDPGLSARRASRRAGGDPPPAADDRHLVARRRPRRSSTSPCPIARWTSASTA